LPIRREQDALTAPSSAKPRAHVKLAAKGRGQEGFGARGGQPDRSSSHGRLSGSRARAGTPWARLQVLHRTKSELRGGPRAVRQRPRRPAGGGQVLLNLGPRPSTARQNKA